MTKNSMSTFAPSVPFVLLSSLLILWISKVIFFHSFFTTKFCNCCTNYIFTSHPLSYVSLLSFTQSSELGLCRWLGESSYVSLLSFTQSSELGLCRWLGESSPGALQNLMLRRLWGLMSPWPERLSKGYN